MSLMIYGLVHGLEMIFGFNRDFFANWIVKKVLIKINSNNEANKASMKSKSNNNYSPSSFNYNNDKKSNYLSTTKIEKIKIESRLKFSNNQYEQIRQNSYNNYSSKYFNPYEGYYNQQCDTEITNYSLNEDLENDESHEYEDDENIKDLIIDEKIESENREYYINKIKDLIEESDLNVNYSMEKINSGEFSEVFKATHKITNKVIVIKSISIRDSKFLNILYNEVLISKVARHSNIIINYTQYIKKDHIYLLMEHCEFGSLYNIRNKKPNKKMNEKEVSFIVKEVLKGLNHLHSIGFIHRDIKAQNILVNSEGKIII
ncbi:18402_t:CDS:2, partial [Entrophospora sp. SA101]